MGYSVTRQARSDLDTIWTYAAMESQSEAVALQLLRSIAEHFVLLGDNPRLGRPRDDDFGIGRRSFVCGEYLIVYRIVRGDVRILRVVHGRPD